jgi:hypothetical protein
MKCTLKNNKIYLTEETPVLEILRKELERYDAFAAPDHEFIDALTRAISFSTVPAKMKLVFAISHLSNFASQFRRNIKLWDGTLVPTNNISFVVADSGANKDSSNSKVKKCFQPGYEIIQKHLEVYVRTQAIKKAQDAGEDLPDEFSVYCKYMQPIPPVFMSITTGPGLVQHINDIGALPVSSSYLYSGEISDELANNVNTLDNIKILAEVYDLGSKEVTYTKGKEFRSQVIDGQPVSALFVGSPGHILYDETTKKRFHIAFMSKLARRSWFCYTPERMYEPDFSSEPQPIKAMEAYESKIESTAKEAVVAVKGVVERLTRYNLERLDSPVPVTEEVFQLFNVYKRYNREVIDKSNNQESVYALVRAHLQWKALKLAGALAIIESCDQVTIDHYVMAIRYCELFDHDISRFERDINKAPHECLADYLRTLVGMDNRAFISIHDIKKHGFSTGISVPKLQELVQLAAGYDTSGVYSVGESGSGIIYEPLQVTATLGVSYKVINNDALHAAIKNNATPDELKDIKKRIALQTADGYSYGETTFEELGELLRGDFAYTAFNFKDGVRNRANIIGGTKWVVFDIDKTTMSYEDVHFMLESYRHHVALSSNPNNPYKYRILLELDSPVTLSSVAWKFFYTKLAEDLGLPADILPQSQIYYAFSDRPILSNLDGETVKVRDYVMYAKEKESDKDVERIKSVSSTQKNQLLSNPMETFWYAYNCEKGQRSLSLYKTARHAIDLGADLEYTLSLLEEINNYVVEPLESMRFNSLKEQVVRLYGGTE